MKLGFEESQSPYESPSQSARAWTERWVRDHAYCPNCGNQNLTSFPNNSPVADFFCRSCSEEFELKSQKSKFGKKVSDGAYQTKCERLTASNNPNLFLMNYDLRQLSVINLFYCPKALFCPRNHRKAQTASADSTPCRMGRIKHFTEPDSRIRKNLHCP